MTKHCDKKAIKNYRYNKDVCSGSISSKNQMHVYLYIHAFDFLRHKHADYYRLLLFKHKISVYNVTNIDYISLWKILGNDSIFDINL